MILQYRKALRLRTSASGTCENAELHKNGSCYWQLMRRYLMWAVCKASWVFQPNCLFKVDPQAAPLWREVGISKQEAAKMEA